MTAPAARGWLVALAIAGASGCAVSGGTTTVGIWRPQRVIDATVCIEERPGVCARTVEVGRDIPARRFAGGMFAFFNPGYMHVTGTDGGRHLFAIDSHYEYLRGRGAWAIGGRVAANVAFGSGRMVFATPVSVVGYWGVPLASLYAGGGYTPYASDKVTMGDTTTRIGRHGPHVLAGARVVLRENRNSRISASVEATRQFLGDLTATSSTANIGLHF